jgi:hypothetical protein
MSPRRIMERLFAVNGEHLNNDEHNVTFEKILERCRSSAAVDDDLKIDLFISYRRDADSLVAERFATFLELRGWTHDIEERSEKLKFFWDKKSIRIGDNWMYDATGFCTGRIWHNNRK